LNTTLLLALLHGYYDGPFLLAWSFDPWVTTGLIAAVAVYWWAWRRVRQSNQPQPPTWYAVSYGGGVATLAFSLLGPLETYNEQIFTLHMTQHLVILQISAPLLLLGRPVQLILRALPRRTTKRTIGYLFGNPMPRRTVLAITAPITVFLLFNGNMGFWHFPGFYESALRDDWVHHLQHILFAGTAMLYWWVIIDPVPRHHRLREIWAMGSVFLSMMIGSIIGAVITLSESILYPFYLEAAHPWGWSPLLDQQIGGVIMWVGSGLLYFVVLFILALQLIQEDERETDRDQAASPQSQTAATS
jgi:putative membrane protein